jgi:hypothetical protein
MNKPGMLFKKAKHIYRTQGLVPFTRSALAFSIRLVLRYERYTLHNNVCFSADTLARLSEADLVPKGGHCTLEIVSSNLEADKLADKGLECRSSDGVDEDRLGRGAVMFCLFQGREPVHKSWLATSKGAMRSLTVIPFPVNFDEGEAYVGRTLTEPGFRRRGFWVYSAFKMQKYLEENRVTVAKCIVLKDNVAAQSAHSKYGDLPYGQGRYLRILWWGFWKEL